MISTLFGHIASHFTNKTENVATEALGYILRGSSVARDAVQTLLGHAGMPIPGNLTYFNQVASDDQAQPDVVGLDELGKQHLVIEAKFWAGLTDHQPITYLKRLPKDGGVLLFIAPAARQDLVWGELLRRCSDASLTGVSNAVGDHALRRYSMADGTHLALVSWRALLEYLIGRVEAAGDKRTLGDLEQLQGLCDAMDSTAFLPLTSEELTDTQRYRRITQFNDLIDELVPALVNLGVADIKGLTVVSRKGIYGKYMRFHGYGAYLSCDINRWANLAPAPFWLTFGQSFEGRCPKEVREALATLTTQAPPQCFIVDKDLLTIPLYVSPGLTKDEVKAEVLRQIAGIGQKLPQAKPGTTAKMGTGEAVA
jgi:hypothetical protein